jgi:hypothetical protein
MLVVARGEPRHWKTRFDAVDERLPKLGVAEPLVKVERRRALMPRPSGKLQIVVSIVGPGGLSRPET